MVEQEIEKGDKSGFVCATFLLPCCCCRYLMIFASICRTNNNTTTIDSLTTICLAIQQQIHFTNCATAIEEEAQDENNVQQPNLSSISVSQVFLT